MKNDEIAGFFLDGWYVFDNFAPFQIEWRGKLYPTSEHAYQAAHFFDTSPETAEVVRMTRSPRQASDTANAHKELDDPDWSTKKLLTMEEICRVKLEQHELVRETLMKSGELQIVEMNESDSFWGWGADHAGENHLGKIWMKLRCEMRDEEKL